MTDDAECQWLDACANAWSEIINKYLQSLITTGKGKPTPKVDKKQAARNL